MRRFWTAKKVVSTTPYWTIIDSEIEEIAKRISVELESATSSELSSASYARMMLSLSDVDYTKMIIQQVKRVVPEDEEEVGKRAIIKLLLLSTWLQRLYFSIRALLMNLLEKCIGSAVLSPYILCFGAIELLSAILLGSFRLYRRCLSQDFLMYLYRN